MKEKISLSVIAVVLTLFLSDWAMALLKFPTEPPLKIAYSPHFTQDVKNLEFSYHFKANGQGIRYREIPFDKLSQNDYRFLVIGDSFTEGLGVEGDETFSAVLEKRLSTVEREIAFINAGLTNASPADYARILYHVGFKYHPDHVMVVVYANDLGDQPILTDAEIESGEGWLVPRKNSRQGMKKIAHRLLPRIYTQVIVLKEYWKQRPKNLVEAAEREARKAGVSPSRIEAWKKSLPKDLVAAANANRFNRSYLTRDLFNPRFWAESLDIKGEHAERKWKSMKGVLTTIFGWCREKKIAVSVVFAPSPLQYDPGYHPQVRRFGGKTRESWLTEKSEIEKRLEELAKEHALPFLNLTDYFRVSNRKLSGACHYSMDGHWTAKGNKVAASMMLKWILDSRMIPEAAFALDPKNDFIFDETAKDLLSPLEEAVESAPGIAAHAPAKPH